MFTDRLKLSLLLTIGSDTFTFSAGSVRELRVAAMPWGFDATATFLFSAEQGQDTIFPRFVTRDLAKVKLTMQRVREDGEETRAFSVSGVVTDKHVEEVAGVDQEGMPVVLRRYSVHFLDAAQALWTQHYPVELHVQSSVNDVLQLHAVAGMQLSAEWVGLGQPQDVLCVGVRGDGGPSFYDFVVWCVRGRNGVIEYDCAADAYRIAGSKAAGPNAVALDPDDVDEIGTEVAEPRRHTTHVLNPSVDAAVADKEIANTDAASGVRRDVVARTAIAAAFDDRVGVETARVRPGEHALTIQFKRFPAGVPAPGDGVALGEGFSASLHAWNKRYRTFRLDLRARRPDTAGEDDLEDDTAAYELELSARADLESDPVVRLPPFRAPEYPVVVEGLVVSASGQDADRTWLTLPNEATSAFEYQVHVPLYNKTVVVAFAPHQLTGHFFFPAYKNQRVLVALDFDRASIVGYLDWAENAKRSRDTQGNAIAFGYGAENGTLVTHEYSDAKPALRIRRTFGGDLQTIDLGEGVIRFEVTQNPTAPAITPTFDVTPQVESAKAQLAGRTTSGVTELSGAFASSSSAAQASLDEATAGVETSVTGATTSLGNRVATAQTQLAAMQADATGAVATIVAAVENAKASITAARADRLKAPLAAVEAKLDALLAETRSRLDALDARVASLDAHRPFADLRAQVTGAQADQQARLASLDAHAHDVVAASMAPLAALEGQVRSLDARLSAAAGDAQSSAAQLGSELSSGWRSLAGEAARGKAQVDSKLRAASGRVRSEARTLAGELARLPSKRTGTPAVQRLDAQIGGLPASAETSAAQIRANLGGVYDAALGRANAGANGAQQRSAGLAAGVTADASALSHDIQALGTTVAQRRAELEADAEKAREACNALVDSLGRQGSALLAPLPGQIDAAEARLAEAVQAAKEALRVPLQAARAALEALASRVRPPLAEMTSAIDAANARLQSGVDQAHSALDGLRDTALGPLQGLVAVVNTAVEAAMQALDGFRQLLAALRKETLAPLEALSSRLADLQSAFKTGVSTLTALLQKGQAALDSISAKGLPEMLVQPALAAIEAAVSAALPAIQSATQAASEGLTSAARTIQSAVGTASQAAASQVSAFAATTGSAIDAVVPPVESKLETVQAQIQAAARTATEQVDALAGKARSTIQEALAQLEAQVTALCSRLESEIDEARTTSASNLEALAAKADAADSQLASSAAAARAPLVAALERARETFDSAAAAAAAQIDAAGSALTARTGEASASARESLAALQGRVDALAPGWRQQQQALRSENESAVARDRAALPSPDATDSAVKAFSDDFAGRISVLRAQLTELV